VVGRKIGLERVIDEEKRREQENHNVGRTDVGSERVNVYPQSNLSFRELAMFAAS
jgi:hypothetical protein